MKIDILTLFPDMFKGVLHESIIGRALNKNIVNINYINIRNFSQDKHNRVDDYPYGGGPGMVMKPEPIARAIDDIVTEQSRIIYLSPRGKVFRQTLAKELAEEGHLVLLCGHYEGIDQRVIDYYNIEQISIGDYVLTGGEIPAMVLVDSIVRLLPGVLGQEASYMEESHYNGLLEHPQYTRPREFKSLNVPEVLISGNHRKIEEWRKYEGLKTTYLNRPDLLVNKKLTEEEEVHLSHLKKEMKSNK